MLCLAVAKLCRRVLIPAMAAQGLKKPNRNRPVVCLVYSATNESPHAVELRRAGLSRCEGFVPVDGIFFRIVATVSSSARHMKSPGPRPEMIVVFVFAGIDDNDQAAVAGGRSFQKFEPLLAPCAK